MENYIKISKLQQKYDDKLLNRTYNIIKEFEKKYKLLNKNEITLLEDYKYTYYLSLNKYLLNNQVTLSNIVNFINKINKTNMRKYQNFTFIKFEKIYNEYLNYLINDINKLNSIIFNYGIKERQIVYRGLHNIDTTSDIYKAITKKGNILNVNTFQSSTLNIYTAFGFTWNNINSLFLEIDTSECPYFYLSWSPSMNLKTEHIMGSEFELLLPRNIKMEYIGKKNLFSYKTYKDWLNYENKTKKEISKEIKQNKEQKFMYKFKIIEYNKNDEIKLNPQNNIAHNINFDNDVLLKNLYFSKHLV